MKLATQLWHNKAQYEIRALDKVENDQLKSFATQKSSNQIFDLIYSPKFTIVLHNNCIVYRKALLNYNIFRENYTLSLLYIDYNYTIKIEFE